MNDFPLADLKTPRDSELEENLGAEVPTGSESQHFIFILKCGEMDQETRELSSQVKQASMFDLCEGGGEAWAGQDRDWAAADWPDRRDRSLAPENLGADLPMGSVTLHC